MKRYGNIYKNIYDMDNLRLAHHKARKGKYHYSEVKMVNNDEIKFLSELRELLKDKEYETSKYEKFKIIDKGKEREIFKLPYYPDRICQWAIMLQIEKVFINNFIFDTYASIPNKGIHLATKRINKALQNKESTKYCLKMDVKKYFPNINHDILKSQLRRKFKDRELLWLLDEIIDSNVNGIPIGNYLSQYFANFYLSGLDHYIKESLKIKYYFRYMDDMIIFSNSKRELFYIKGKIEEYLNNRLKLQLKENWQVFPTFIRGVDFLGYRHFGNYILLRKNISYNIKSKIRNINKKFKLGDLNSLMSYHGWCKHCNSFNFQKVYFYDIIRRLNKYESSIR